MLLEPGLGVVPRLRDEDGAGSALFSLCQEKDADQEAAESDRLFYVAATRARDKLILNGCFKLTNAGAPGWLGGWLKQVSGPVGLAGRRIDHDEEGERAVQLDLQVGETSVGCTVYEPQYGGDKRWVLPDAGETSSEGWRPDVLEAYGAAEKAPRAVHIASRKSLAAWAAN